MFQSRINNLIKFTVICFVPLLILSGCHKKNEKKKIEKVFITFIKGTIDFPTPLDCNLLVKCDFMPTKDTIITGNDLLDSLLIQLDLVVLGDESYCDSRLKAIVQYNFGKNDTLCFGEAFCGVMNGHSILNSDGIANYLKDAVGYYDFLPWDCLIHNKIYKKYHYINDSIY
ncbi:MAG: hypothetical protein IPH45_01795 [Bacteroidales bacterium]|nr:hypothetical protein [Bacteroidales bacterium]